MVKLFNEARSHSPSITGGSPWPILLLHLREKPLNLSFSSPLNWGEDSPTFTLVAVVAAPRPEKAWVSGRAFQDPWDLHTWMERTSYKWHLTNTSGSLFVSRSPPLLYPRSLSSQPFNCHYLKFTQTIRKFVSDSLIQNVQCPSNISVHCCIYLMEEMGK